MSSTASLASRGDDDTASLDLDYQPDPKRKKVVKYTDPVCVPEHEIAPLLILFYAHDITRPVR